MIIDKHTVRNLEKLVKSEVVALSQTCSSMSYDVIVKSGSLFRDSRFKIGSKSKVKQKY